MPLWLRWFIALPCVSILGAMAIRRLVFADFFEAATSGIIIPAAIAVIVFGAAQIAARVAPSYKKHVGLAVAFSELAVYFAAFFYSAVYSVSEPRDSMFESYDPAKIASFNFIAPLIGAASAIVSLAMSKTSTDDPMQLVEVHATDLGLRRGLGISLALAASAAFEAAAFGTTMACYACFPTSYAFALSAVVSTGVMVTLVIAYEPVRKNLAAWLVAGVFIVPSLVVLGFVVAYSIRYGVLYRSLPLLEFETYFVAILSIGTIIGTILGLYAAASKPSQPDSSAD